MPGLVLRISGDPNQELTRRIVPEIMALTCSVLHKKREQTMVMLQYVSREHWFIAGKSLAEHGKNSFRLEVTVTDETNTKEQKAAYHKAATLHYPRSSATFILIPISTSSTAEPRLTATVA